MAFDFYEITEKGANSAVMAFQDGVSDIIGEFTTTDLLRLYAKHNRGFAHSMVRNFRFIPATYVSRDMKTVDMNKIERDYVRNGYQADDAKAFIDTITFLKDYKLRMQVYPKKYRVQSDVVNIDDQLLAGENDARSGMAAIVADAEFIRGMLNTETLEHNQSFFDALDDTINNGIVYKKTRWDGGVNVEGDKDEVIALPEWCKYTTKNEGYLSISDLLYMRAQLDENMANNASLAGGRLRPMTLIMSPYTAAQFVDNNDDRNNLLQKAVFGEAKVGDMPSAYGFTFYRHDHCPDNMIYGITPGVTLEVFDWGTRTACIQDPLVDGDKYIRRVCNYGVKVTQPLSMLAITIKGVTNQYRDVTVKNADGTTTTTDRRSAITTETDEPLKPIRKPKKS